MLKFDTTETLSTIDDNTLPVENFFIEKIKLYYSNSDVENKNQVTRLFIQKILTLSQAENFSVRAPKAISALSKLADSDSKLKLEDIYDSFYMLMHAIILGVEKFGVSGEDCDVININKDEAKRILIEIQNYINSNVCDREFKDLHDNMAKRKYKRSSLDALMPRARLTTYWMDAFGRGTSDNVEERYYYIAFGADLFIRMALLEKFSTEGQWVVINALIHFSQEKLDSPFYDAIKIAQNYNPNIFTELYEKIIFSISSKENGKNSQAEILNKEIYKLLPDLDKIFSSFNAKVDGETFSKDSISDISSIGGKEKNIWAEYSKKYQGADKVCDDENERKFILKHFDKECQRLDGEAKDLVPVFLAALKKSNKLFSPYAIANQGTFFSSKNASPIGFDNFMKSIMPKKDCAPFAFALYCFDLIENKNEVCREYEVVFIRDHIKALYAYRDSFKKISITDELTLADYIAPLGYKDTSAMKLIYPLWDKELCALEKGYGLTIEVLEKHFNWCPTDKQGNFFPDLSPKNKSGQSIGTRIRTLKMDLTKKNNSNLKR